MFQKYTHVERWGNTEVEGVELGTCHVFPKIDGTNASVWWDCGVQCGSRNRLLSEEADNAGFHAWIQKSEESNNIGLFLRSYPNFRLYGEWLVPHSLKTYREDVWRKFYVFDVAHPACTEEGEMYMSYEDYQPLLESFGLDYISPLRIIKNGNYQQFLGLLEANDFLMQDGHTGEGIVIKNYEYQNRYGRNNWAKIVSSEFKEKHVKAMGAPQIDGKKMVEQEIADEFVTQALCEKVKAKIELDEGDWSSKYISRLLQTVYYDVVREECWSFVKKHKNPTVNFKTLQTLVTMRIKQLLPEVF